MKLLVFLVVIILLNIMLFPVSCEKTQETASLSSSPEKTPETVSPSSSLVSTPPLGATPGASNDDIVYPPGGYSYRANVHQAGLPDWPPVLETEITINALGGTIRVKYRDYIETRAGEKRNNLIYLSGQDAPDLLDPLQMSYRTEGLADDFSINIDDQMYGGIGGRDKKSSRVILQIHIAAEAKPEEYPFSIYLDYKGKNIGTLPSTIKVIK